LAIKQKAVIYLSVVYYYVQSVDFYQRTCFDLPFQD